MIGDLRLGISIGILLLIGNGFLVAAEYGLVGARRTRIEALAKKGNSSAIAFLKALTEVHSYIAGIQIGITMIGIAFGVIVEPFVAKQLSLHLGELLGEGVSVIISFLFVTYCLVMIGDIIPKYLALQYAEKVALFLIKPLKLFIFPLKPLIWLVHSTGSVVLKPLGVDMKKFSSDAFTKDELMLLVKAGGTSGTLEEDHAHMISKALKLDVLDAQDVMIHRIDIDWIDINIHKDELLSSLAKISHNYVPVCNGDIDEIVGFLRVMDVLKKINSEDFKIENILHKVEAIPENLPLSKIISRMRKTNTQILVVLDEYGGTSGLVTLVDIIEEVFGEFAEGFEGKRAPIEKLGDAIYSARSNVRYDELIDFLEIDPEDSDVTDTLATVIVSALGTVPKLGNTIETHIGTMTVETMTHSRINRVKIHLKPEFQTSPLNAS